VKTEFPDSPGVSAKLFTTNRRRPGSAVGAGNIEEVHALAIKCAYIVHPADPPANGWLEPDPAGPAVLEADALVGDAVSYESDLVPTKPEADLIVIPGGAVAVSVAVDGVVRLTQQGLADFGPAGLAWESRKEGPRPAEGGDFTAMTQALPDGFSNRWFNGYRRTRAQGAVPHLAPGARIGIRRQGVGAVYGFTLPLLRPVVSRRWYGGSGRDDPCLWHDQALTPVLDTLVTAPETHRAYAVWRVAFAPAGGAGGPAAPDQNRAVALSLAEA
jgi:hypothetical protein